MHPLASCDVNHWVETTTLYDVHGWRCMLLSVQDKEAFEHSTGKGACQSSSGKRKADDAGEAGSDHTSVPRPCPTTSIIDSPIFIGLFCPHR